MLKLGDLVELSEKAMSSTCAKERQVGDHSSKLTGCETECLRPPVLPRGAYSMEELLFSSSPNVESALGWGPQ